MILSEFKPTDAELIYGNLSNSNKLFLDNKINEATFNLSDIKIDNLLEEASIVQKSLFIDAYNKGLITDEKLDLLLKLKEKNKFVLSSFNYSLFDDDIYKLGPNILSKLSRYSEVVDQIVELKSDSNKFNLFLDLLISDTTVNPIVADQKMSMLLNYLLRHDINPIFLKKNNILRYFTHSICN